MGPAQRRAAWLLGGAAGAAGATVAYAAGVERLSFRLRRFEVPVLAPGSAPIRVLHISDLHLTPNQRRKQAWVRELVALDPHLIVNTGDTIAHPDAVGPALQMLEPFLDRPGVFVFGSNDYFEPQPKNPVWYLVPAARESKPGKELPWRDLRAGFEAAGWQDLSNQRAALDVDGRTLAFVGVDDPHIDRDRYHRVAGPPPADADLPVGVTHSPEPHVLDAMAGDGYRLLLAGHTHGGQLCVPGYGALVTNCGIDRERVKGLHRWDDAWLHVSAGLGTSPWAPVRFACPPEASLLTLVAAG